MRLPRSGQLKTALVHHWLVTRRGGEHVFDALLEQFPAAPVYTLVCDLVQASPSLHGRVIRTSVLQNLPRAGSWYPYYLPLYPYGTERLDLREFQLVISSDAATVKGVRTDPGAVHICYCHTPMRYVWSGFEDYARTLNPLARRFFARTAERLRRWDFEAAQKVTRFVANSGTVAGRIRRYYGRASTIIYPPVDTEYFVPDFHSGSSEDYYLLVSQLVPYKRADIVVEAFNRSGRALVVIGEGSEAANLRQRALSNVRIIGAQPRGEIRRYMQTCRGFVFAGDEDFGIVLAEAQACGTPVLAYGRGGATEIVQNGRTGVLFEQQSVDGLLDGLDRLEKISFDRDEIRHSALRFNRERFIDEFSRLVDEALAQKGSNPAIVSPASPPMLTASRGIK